MLTSKQRKVEAEIFTHPSFRRASYVARELYLGLIIAVADDEGRFLAEPFHLLEQCFSRVHDATEQQVAEALEWWAGEGMIVLYDGYGFLAGWYEHQYIDRRVREESAHPEPPNVDVASWAQADAIADEYRSAKGRDRVTVRDATRWHKQLPEHSGKHRKTPENSASRARTPAPTPAPAPTPGGNARAGTEPPAPEPPLREDTTCNHIASAAWAYWRDARAPGGADNWTQQLLSAFRTLQAQPDPLTEDELVACFTKHPPLPSEFPDKWVSRCYNQERGFPGRNKSRASPANGRTVNAPASEADFAAALAEQRQKLGEEVDSGPTDDPFDTIKPKRLRV